MSLLSLSIGPGPNQLSYARARLRLGITGVGIAVVAASSVLFFDIPSSSEAMQVVGPLIPALGFVGGYGMLMVLLFFLTDQIGGAWLVRRREPVRRWLTGWLRGVVLQWCVWMATAAALMLSARWYGLGATIGVFVIVQCLLAALRGPFARLLASLPLVPTPPAIAAAAAAAGIAMDRLRVVEASDTGFVGGWSGLWARTLYVPQHWQTLPPSILQAQLVRRQITAQSGAHRRGVLGAIVWNTLGFVTVLGLTNADLATAAGIITMAAGLTLWAFLGVLLLPTPSRTAVYAIDAGAVERCGVTAVQEAITTLDRWQDDEPTRTPVVERIFHPVPSRANRIRRLQEATSPAGASGIGAWSCHHLARHALWLGWGMLTPISRVVHCNAGRPQLWAMLPGD